MLIIVLCAYIIYVAAIIIVALLILTHCETKHEIDHEEVFIIAKPICQQMDNRSKKQDGRLTNGSGGGVLMGFYVRNLDYEVFKQSDTKLVIL